MSVALAGRAIAVVGIVTGLLAISLPTVLALRYVDDGTVAAFLLILICCASWFPAEVGPTTLGAAAGAAAFGYFLFVPAAQAFDQLGDLESGAWLGICAVLVPLGAGIVWAAEREPGPADESRTAAAPVDRALLLTFVGLALFLAGIWLPAESNDTTYWDVSSSGHALGILMLVLAVLNAALALLGKGRAADVALLVAATTFGLAEVGVVTTAFEEFGNLGSGAWLQACGGVFLLIGAAMRSTAARVVPAAAAAPTPAPAQ